MKRESLAAVAALLSLASTAASAADLPAGFVRLADTDPTIRQDVRYAGVANFLGRPAEGYEAPVCILTRQAADALSKVQKTLAAEKLTLVVFDCYRPARATAHFLRWSRDRKDTKTKGEFYPDLDKEDLFRAGYISLQSAHSRGSTVDLTLVDILPGQDGNLRERDMGTRFDFFSPYSAPSDRRVSEEARSNRRLLADAMRRSGFIPYGKEWWHFTLAHEPFPQTYFDFEVR